MIFRSSKPDLARHLFAPSICNNLRLESQIIDNMLDLSIYRRVLVIVATFVVQITAFVLL
jgi:hypothetical protein